MGGIVNTTKLIAVKPGTSVYPGGQDIYTRGADGKPKLLVREGEFVAINPKTQKSLGAEEIASVDAVDFAVGWGKSKYGRADTLRKISLNKCSLRTVAAENYRCGTSAVTDIEFDCIQPDEVYTFHIEVEDYLSESFSPKNMPLRRHFTVNTHECKCEPECEPTYDCQNLVKDFVRTINGIKKYKDDPGLDQWIELHPNENLPFYAHVRYDYAYQFCLTPETADCDLCTHVPGIKGIKLGSENNVTFDSTLDPDHPTLTMREQVLDIVDQINMELGYGTDEEVGVATVSGSTGKCCDLVLEINTNESSVKLVDHEDSDVEPCGTEDFTGENGCAIRIVAKELDLSCLCDTNIPDPRINLKTRNLSVGVSGDAWTCGTHRVITVSKSTPPINLGYDLIELDVNSHVGGIGRGHDNFNTFRGKYNTADPKSRIKNASPYIKCEEGYCTISLEDRGYFGGHFQKFANGVPSLNMIVLQHDDYDNIKDVQELVNAFLSGGSCPIFKTVQCIDDENESLNPAVDQSGYGGYDGSKGYEDAND